MTDYFACGSSAQLTWHDQQEVDDVATYLANDNLTDMRDLRSARVLLIEDDRTMQRMVSKSIGDYCDLIKAPTSGNGISKYLNFDPDIIFLDLNLPDNNGHKILKWIMWNDPGAYVVIFSSYCDSANIEKALNSGAKDYVPKPFNPGKMMSYILQCPKLHVA
ncbi:response regulator [Alphaproteobacteria bacterium]|nr:response regulator [Alphaproteobacteria bacterium]